MKKRGQVTIFLIIGIVLLAVVVIFFFLNKQDILNPNLKKTYDLEDGLGKKNISILCYNQNFYTPCINQEPMLVNHVRDEIEKNISQDVKQCFDNLVIVAQEIISQEARFCHFENLGYMLFYKNFNIDKFKTGDF